MYKRVRDLSKVSDLGSNNFESVSEMLASPLRQGLNTIKLGGKEFDFFYEDRGAKVTFVTFAAAIGAKTPNYPIFSSRLVAGRIGANYLAFADTASGGSEALTTFWHMGTAAVPTREIVPQIVRKAEVEGSGENLLFFGSSAGGFAALNYGAHFPGSATLVMNPRINLLNEPKHMPRYVPVAFPGEDLTTRIRKLPYDQAKHYSEPHGNHVFYMQNMQDPNYKRHHYAHFEKAVRGRNDVTFVTGNWGDGHVVPPRPLFEGLLSRVVASAPDWEAVSLDGLPNL